MERALEIQLATNLVSCQVTAVIRGGGILSWYPQSVGSHRGQRPHGPLFGVRLEALVYYLLDGRLSREMFAQRINRNLSGLEYLLYGACCGLELSTQRKGTRSETRWLFLDSERGFIAFDSGTKRIASRERLSSPDLLRVSCHAKNTYVTLISGR